MDKPVIVQKLENKQPVGKPQSFSEAEWKMLQTMKMPAGISWVEVEPETEKSETEKPKTEKPKKGEIQGETKPAE